VLRRQLDELHDIGQRGGVVGRRRGLRRLNDPDELHDHGNSAKDSGGGVCGSPTLTDCTISGNLAGWSGGGVYGGSRR